MIRHHSWLLVGLTVVAAMVASVGGTATPVVQTASSDPQAGLTRARAALAAGRLDEAVAVADALLASSPANRDAVEVKIRALVAGRRAEQALSAYGAFAGRTKQEDARLVAIVAESELRALSSSLQTELRLRAEALERLARVVRSATARAELERLRATTSGRFTIDASLARLGDVKAALRLAELAASPTLPNKVPVIEALQAADAKQQAFTLVPLLADPNPLVRAAAAEAIGALGYREALPQLRSALEDPVPRVRMGAAIAVGKLGDPAADAQIRAWLKSDSAGVRLMAVEAMTGGKSREWVAVAKALLSDPDGLTRLRAAELLAAAEPDAAHAVLAKAASDPNPAVREEATRILETLPPYDVKLLRGLLVDRSPWVRLRVAGALVAAGRPAGGK
jgi:HEAT repeat protein